MFMSAAASAYAAICSDSVKKNSAKTSELLFNRFKNTKKAPIEWVPVVCRLFQRFFLCPFPSFLKVHPAQERPEKLALQKRMTRPMWWISSIPMRVCSLREPSRAYQTPKFVEKSSIWSNRSPMVSDHYFAEVFSTAPSLR